MAIAPYKKVVQPDNSGSELLRGILKIGGGIVGGIYGGPGGAAAGATAGDMVGGAIAPDKEVEVSESNPIQASTSEDPMQRRLAEANNNPSVQIADANAALSKMPPELQDEYGPALQKAQALSRGGRMA